MVNPIDGGIHVFDSNSEDATGVCAIGGTAVVVYMCNIKFLIQHLERLFSSLSVGSDEQFEIVPVEIASALGSLAPAISHVQTSTICNAVPASFQRLTRERQEQLGIGNTHVMTHSKSGLEHPHRDIHLLEEHQSEGNHPHFTQLLQHQNVVMAHSSLQHQNYTTLHLLKGHQGEEGTPLCFTLFLL